MNLFATRRRKKWLIIGASALALFLAFLAVLPEVVRRVAIKQIGAATNRGVAIEDIDINLFTRRIAIKNFRLADRAGAEPLVGFKDLTLAFYYLPLFTKHLRFSDIALSAPSIGLKRTGASEFNFSDLLAPETKPPEKKEKGGVDFTVEHFRLSDGAVVLEDGVVKPASSWKAEGLNFDAADVSTRTAGPAGRATLKLTLAGTPISLNASELRLTPQNGRAALSFEGFDLALLLPYVPADAPATLTSGRLGAALTLTYGGAAGAQLDGEVRLEKIAVLQHGQTEPFLAAPELKVELKNIRMNNGVFDVAAIEVAGDPTLTDTNLKPAAAFDLKQLKVLVEKLTWPESAPARVQISAQLPKGGALVVDGTVGQKPVKADLRVRLKDADLAAYQRYLPVAAPVAGKADADIAVVASTEGGLKATASGKAAVIRLALGPRGAPLVTVEQASAAGLDIRWPGQIKVGRVEVRKPWALVERDKDGALPLRAAFAPPAGDAKKPAAPKATPVSTAAAPPPSKAPARPPAEKGPAIEIAEIVVADGFARFIDRTGEPPYTEELSRLAINIKGLSNAPGKKGKLTLQSVIGATGALELKGDIAPLGETLFLDLDGELRDFAIPRVNPYTDRLLSWIARDGRLGTKVHFKLDGDKLDATSEIVVGRLDLVQAAADDKVKDKIGLPLGLIVALMKDARGEIRVNVPIAGSLSAPQFSLSEAIWTAVRNVLVNVLAAPFRLIGRMFTSDDKITGFAVDPIKFEPGSAAVGPAADEQLKGVGEFLRNSPYVRLSLAPVASEADILALKTQEVAARLQRIQREERYANLPQAAQAVFIKRFPGRKVPENGVDGIVAAFRDVEPRPDGPARALADRRVEAVRERLGSSGAEAKRLERAEKSAPDDAKGEGRVEFSILP